MKAMVATIIAAVLLASFGVRTEEVIEVQKIDVERMMRELKAKPNGEGIKRLAGSTRETAEKMLALFNTAKDSVEFVINIKSTFPEKEIYIRDSDSDLKRMTIKLARQIRFYVHYNSKTKELLHCDAVELRDP